MAFQFNPYTGEFDEILVTSGVPTPQFTLDGEAEAPMVTVTNGLYSRLLGAFYYGFNTGAVQPSGGGKILMGQPIPIGMGLTFLYSQDISIGAPAVVNIKRGQPIPIGMGLTQTYANDVT